MTVTVPSEAMLPAAQQFYQRIGGVPLVRPEMLAADTPGCWLGFDGTQVHLIVGHADPGPAHFALDVGDAYDAVLQELEASGVSRRDARQSWGARRCFVNDPAGNLVELFERSPDSIPEEPPLSPG
ncbi:MAG TPA: VOC family protein [Actinomycetota bacterium]|nr:VOC family protein [Actinomycetota bacterium]